ncbi:MAG: protein-L-isoaspartate(D-aspartate) O-methyltransferase [Spirochaetota bacterium]
MEPRSYWNITDKRVLEAIRRVPRERFVPERVRSESDGDFPLPIGYGQTISQPYIVAYMSEQLQVAGHHRVLEVGTGSGYQAAVLAELAGEVYTVESIPELSRQAGEVLEELGYTNVTPVVGNGREGYPLAAPYDRIMVTAASEDFPQELTRQLAVGGRMMIPVGPEQSTQYLYLCTKLPSREVTCDRLLAVRFVPLVP